MSFFKLTMKNNVGSAIGTPYAMNLLEIFELFTSDCTQATNIFEVGKNCHGPSYWFC
jgi:hypothetical protein